jgi:hypothetical protein
MTSSGDVRDPGIAVLSAGSESIAGVTVVITFRA